MALDHDGIFKQLLSAFFIEFLELFAPDVLELLDRDTITFLATDSFVDLLDPDRRTADLLAQAQLKGELASILIHLEHQAQADMYLDRRMFRYFARFYDRYDRPIYPIALCSYPSPRRPAPAGHHLKVGSTNVLDFYYKVVQLNNLSWRDYLNSTNPLAVALMARMQIAPNDRWRVKATCLRLLAGLPLSAAQRRMLAAFVSIYLPLDTHETELFQAELDTWREETKETVVELMTEWEVKGLEQGRIEGRIEGRTEERQELILRLLTRKVGLLPQDVQNRIVALSPDTLLDLSEALLDFSSLSDLTDWLERNG